LIYAIALCLYVLCYLVIQVMFLFYGCHISQHKRKVFVILVVYTILFKGMDFLLLSPDPSAMPTTTYWVYWSVYKCQDKYAQKFSYKYVQFILLSILSRFLGKGAEADKIFLLL
jgi:hypothetical protein